MTTVTAVIPTIPPRRRLLLRALASVKAQTRPADEVLVEVDGAGDGAAATRNRALEKVAGEWVAFLDDDDMWHPWHLEHLLARQAATGADVVYPWFEGMGTDEGVLTTLVDGQHVSPFGVEFGPEQAEHLRTAANFIPICVLARTELLRQVGGFTPPPWASPDNPCEDWGCWVKLVEAGARFAHLPERTWRWVGRAGHTSGRSWTQVPELSKI